jgi:nucleotide-binding universal stress UspA family protein|tara:strand:- start:38 stop:871 length:834 start_codon:yes stop_codon:yes gene_type:complete
MSLKKILVHLAHDDQHMVRLDVGIRLAKAQGAALAALYITFPSGMPEYIAGRGASQVYLEEAYKSAKRHAEELRAEAEKRCADSKVELEWLVVNGEHLKELTYQAHVADITIVSQPSEASYLEDHIRTRLAEELVMASGSPVLILPRRDEEPLPVFGRHIMVAWNPSREAVRAVRDALPLLINAEKVSVVTIGKTPEDMASESEVVAFLARHGVPAEPYSVRKEQSVGPQLLSTAQVLNCDMIVMGAYGHSRIYELVMGGATRHVMNHTERPVLMSH